MAVSNDQHLKHTEIPSWVLTRLRQYIDSVGGKKAFMNTFEISESYLSLMWNGKRHPPQPLHAALGIRLVVTPIHYEDLKGDAK